MKDIVDRMTLWVTKMVQEGSKPTLTKPAWHGGFGWAHKVIKAGEGRQTARRLAREQQNRHATQANTHQILVHGKHCMEESVLIFIAKVYWLAISTIPQGERETWRNKQSQIRAWTNGRTFKVTKRRHNIFQSTLTSSMYGRKAFRQKTWPKKFPPQAKILLLLTFRKIEIVRQDGIMHVQIIITA